MNPTDSNPGTNASNPGDSQFLQMMAQASGEAARNGPPALSATPTMAGLVQALRRRWLTAVTVGGVAMVVAVFSVFQLMPPKYLVTIRLQILAAKQAGTDDIEFPLYKANMESLVKSPRVIKAALGEKLSDGRDVSELAIIKNKGPGAVDWLEKALKTDFLLGPEILRVTLAADHPDEAADILNAISRAFLNECAELDRTKRQQRIADLRAKKDRIEEDLRLLRNTLQKLMIELGIRDNDAANLIHMNWLHKLATAETLYRTNNEEIAKSAAEVISLQSKLAKIDQFKVPQDFLDETHARDRVIDGYLKKIANLDDEIETLRQTLVEPIASEAMLPKKRQKAEIKFKIAGRELELLPDIEKRFRAKVYEEIDHQLAITKEKENAYKQRGELLVKEVQDLGRKATEAGQQIRNKPPTIVTLEEKIEVARAGLNQAALRIGEVELEVPGSRVRLTGVASPPLDKDISRQSKVAGAGGLGIFCLMLFGVAMLEFRSRKISVAEDVSHGLGLNVVGTVPAIAARSRRESAQSTALEQQWQSQLNESIDSIRTVILHGAKSETMRVIMVTSANSGEGKTTLATQLAASLSRAWKRTLIVDGDLRHPGVHTLFDVPREPGLAEVLRGEVEADDAVRATPLSRLWVLPAGNGDSHAIQALAQDNVGTIFAAFKQQYDFIIIDTPPVLPVTDTLLLGEHANGILFAILRDVSRAPAVYAAQQKLAPLGIHTLGAVILGAETEHSDKNYRYAVASGN